MPNVDKGEENTRGDRKINKLDIEMLELTCPNVIFATYRDLIDINLKAFGEGVQKNDTLTLREAGSLIRGQARVHKKEQQFKSDGVVTAGERTKLFLMQTKQSGRIYRKKHN